MEYFVWNEVTVSPWVVIFVSAGDGSLECVVSFSPIVEVLVVNSLAIELPWTLIVVSMLLSV